MFRSKVYVYVVLLSLYITNSWLTIHESINNYLDDELDVVEGTADSRKGLVKNGAYK